MKLILFLTLLFFMSCTQQEPEKPLILHHMRAGVIEYDSIRSINTPFFDSCYKIRFTREKVSQFNIGDTVEVHYQPFFYLGERNYVLRGVYKITSYAKLRH